MSAKGRRHVGDFPGNTGAGPRAPPTPAMRPAGAAGHGATRPWTPDSPDRRSRRRRRPRTNGTPPSPRWARSPIWRLGFAPKSLRLQDSRGLRRRSPAGERPLGEPQWPPRPRPRLGFADLNRRCVLFTEWAADARDLSECTKTPPAAAPPGPTVRGPRRETDRALDSTAVPVPWF